MAKTFTCKELGGVCDQEFTGDSAMTIAMKAMPHMMSDDAHKQSIMQLEQRTGESKEQWIARMQQEFAARKDNA